MKKKKVSHREYGLPANEDFFLRVFSKIKQRMGSRNCIQIFLVRDVEKVEKH